MRPRRGTITRVNFSLDDKIMHPARPEWGLGRVIEVLQGDKIRVFFVGGGEKVLNTKAITLTKVEGEDALHPLLDNLKTDKSRIVVRYTSIRELIGLFLSVFSEGFNGDDYFQNERQYKLEASRKLKEELGRDIFHDLLSDSNFNEICKRASYIVNSANLIYPNEKISLKDGIKSEKNMQMFSVALFELMYGKENMENRFVEFINILDELDASKWTIATYFPFLSQPERQIFMKPEATKWVADICSFELDYRPEPNWSTYRRLLEFSSYLFDELKELRPMDMIDVQSFIWCVKRIDEGAYRKDPPKLGQSI